MRNPFDLHLCWGCSEIILGWVCDSFGLLIGVRIADMFVNNEKTLWIDGIFCIHLLTEKLIGRYLSIAPPIYGQA